MDSCGPTRLPSMPMLWPMDRQASVKSIELLLTTGSQAEPTRLETQVAHSHHHDPVLRSRCSSWQVGSWIKELKITLWSTLWKEVGISSGNQLSRRKSQEIVPHMCIMRDATKIKAHKTSWEWKVPFFVCVILHAEHSPTSKHWNV